MRILFLICDESSCNKLILEGSTFCEIGNFTSVTFVSSISDCVPSEEFCHDKCGFQSDGCDYVTCQPCRETCLGKSVCDNVECGAVFDNCYHYHCGECETGSYCENNQCVNSVCGDGVCKGETCDSCPQDCGSCDEYTCPSTCVLPNCRCASNSGPGGIATQYLPQFVWLTIDDATTESDWTEWYYPFLKEGINDTRGRGASFTFFNNNDWTQYQHIRHFLNLGSELATHTVTHTTSYETSKKTWWNELSSSINIYEELTQTKIKGLRCPKLEWSENSFETIKELGLRYDSSLIESVNNFSSTFIWPFTLDYGAPQLGDGNMDNVFKGNYHGLWEIPLSALFQENGEPLCSMDIPLEGDEMYNSLMYNFELRYNTTKSPFGIFLHGPWFTESRYTELVKFAKKVAELDDVFFMTGEEIIDYMENPLTATEFQKTNPKPIVDQVCTDGNKVHTCKYIDQQVNTCYKCLEESPHEQTLYVG
ncbi:NodB-like proteiny domain-containing protein [Entamoeba marina]